MFFAWIFQSRKIEKKILRETQIANELAAVDNPAAAERLAQLRETSWQRTKRARTQLDAAKVECFGLNPPTVLNRTQRKQFSAYLKAKK